MIRPVRLQAFTTAALAASGTVLLAIDKLPVGYGALSAAAVNLVAFVLTVRHNRQVREWRRQPLVREPQ